MMNYDFIKSTMEVIDTLLGQLMEGKISKETTTEKIFELYKKDIQIAELKSKLETLKQIGSIDDED